MNFTERGGGEGRESSACSLFRKKIPSRNGDITVPQSLWSGLLRDEGPHWHDTGLFWHVSVVRGAGWLRELPMVVKHIALKKSPWGDRYWFWIQEWADIPVLGITSTLRWDSIAQLKCVQAFFLTMDQHYSLCCCSLGQSSGWFRLFQYVSLTNFHLQKRWI